MKVLFITPAYYPNLRGGSERSIKMITEGLSKKGMEVTVLSFDGEGKRKNETINGVKVIRVKKLAIAPNTFAHNISLLLHKKIVLEEKPDIIHVYNTWHIPAAYFLRNTAPVVATLNNYYPIITTAFTNDNIIEKGSASFFKIVNSIAKTLDGNFIKRYFLAIFYSKYSIPTRYFSKRIDGYIVYSNAIKEIYERWGFDSSKFTCITSPFEKKKIKTNTKREKNSVLYVGGIYEAKGFYDVFEATRILKNKNIKFYLVGPKNIPKDMIEAVKNEKLKVEFIPKLEHKELSKYYLKASVLVHPSRWPEPFSRVWIEALQHKIPIISSDNPAALDILKGNAIFYERGKPQELARAIGDFLSGKLKCPSKTPAIFKEDYIGKIEQFYKKIKLNL